MTNTRDQEKIRVLFSTLLPAVRIATSALTPLKEMKQLIELAYYREARQRKYKLKEICGLLSISMSKAGLLSNQLKEHFSSSEVEHGLPRRILALLWASPLSETKLAQVLSNAKPEEVSEAIQRLLAENQVVVIPGRTVVRYRLAAPQYRLVKDHWLAMIDGLNNFMRSVSLAIESRFFRRDDRAFARTLSFRVKKDSLERLKEVYHEYVYPLVVKLDGEVAEDEDSIPLSLSICWAVDDEDDREHD